MIKLLFGQDEYAIEAEVATVTTAETAEIRNVGTDETASFISNLASSSFFNEKRIFIAREILGTLSDKQFDLLSESLNNLDKNTDIVFVEKTKPKSVKIVNLIKKLGEVKESPLSKNLNLTKFVKDKVYEEGGAIAPLAAERLATFVGPDLWQITEEVKKLVLYKTTEKGTAEIETADVELLVHANFEATIFELTDALASRSNRKAASLISSFLNEGKNEIYILTMIARQFRNIAMAKFEPGATQEKLAKNAGMHPFVAQKSIYQAKNFTKEEILNMYSQLVIADLKLKSGADPAQTLLRLVA